MKKNKLLILLSLALFMFSSCNLNPLTPSESGSDSFESESVPCTHSNVVLDAEVEPTPKKNGYTAGHRCDDCDEILDGHDTLVYKSISLESFNCQVRDDTFNLTHEGFAFKGSYLTSDNHSISLKYRGTFTNQTQFYRLKSLSFRMSISYGLIYVTTGENALPLSNEQKITAYSYNEEFDSNERFFVISNRGNTKVIISNINIVCYMLESGEEYNKLPNITICTEKNAPIDSKEIYTNALISVNDPINSDYNIVDAEAGIRIRGNSTSQLPKKPYRIKFDKKQSMFGLTKAKSWVLLAEWYDPTSMHNFMAHKIMGLFEDAEVVLNPIHVTVTLNGEYQGLYVLMEQPDEKEGRVDISQDITEDMDVNNLNYLIELDNRAPEGGKENLNYVTIYGDDGPHYYEIKYPEIDEFPDYNETSNTSIMFTKFLASLKNQLNAAVDAMDDKNPAKIQQIFDISSIYNQAIVDLYTDERDHYWLSIKLFKDETGKIHFGPIWDYDATAFGFVWNTSYYKDPFNEKAVPYYIPSNPWLKTVAFDIEETHAKFKTRFQSFFEEYLDDILNIFHNEQGYIASEVMKDAVLWKEDNISINFENYRFLEHYLTERYYDILENI